MLKIKDILTEIEKFAPLPLQENYDNSGLIIGNADNSFTGALLTIDVTEPVIEEAVQKGVNLIIAHHPIIFTAKKKITGQNFIERTIIQAIKNDIAIYAAHTNLDNLLDGVNRKIGEKLNLKNCRILDPLKNQLKKLVTFIPLSHADQVRMAIFEAGAGHIGNYDSCSYNIQGKGSFRALEGSNPFTGKPGQVHFEDETRFETIFPAVLQNKVIQALAQSHPYEEVAYDIYPLENEYRKFGAGMIGELDKPVPEIDFLNQLKTIFHTKVIKHTPLLGKNISKIAFCGGSGSFLLEKAIRQNADIFISSDFKYHQYFDAENKIIIADIGHYESEQFTKELFYDILIKKISNFALYFSEVNTNPVHYL
jgi:dinuclear metal center YbgI/SA1388 family protein